MVGGHQGAGETGPLSFIDDGGPATKLKIDMTVYSAFPIGPGDPVLLDGEEVGVVVSVSDGVADAEVRDDLVTSMYRAGIPQASIQMVLNMIV